MRRSWNIIRIRSIIIFNLRSFDLRVRKERHFGNDTGIKHLRPMRNKGERPVPERTPFERFYDLGFHIADRFSKRNLTSDLPSDRPTASNVLLEVHTIRKVTYFLIDIE